MDHTFPLVADVLRRKLPEAKIAPGEHKLAGTALVDLDVTVAKSAPTEAAPTLPYKAILAVLARGLGDTAPVVLAKATREALKADGDIPLPVAVEAMLEKIREKLPTKPREGPTKVAGTVELVGFAPAAIVLPGWREVKAAIAAARS
jgi:hypothetical protein